jgi:MFS family permease
MFPLKNLKNNLRTQSNIGFIRLVRVRWFGQFADGFFQASLATFILFSPEREPTAASAAIAFTVVLLPYSFIGPFLGTYLDRFSRQAIVELSNYLRFGLTLLTALILKLHSASIQLTITVLMVFGLGRLVLAALSAGLPVVVKKTELVSLNAISVTFGTIFQFIGIGIAAALKTLMDKKMASDSSDAIIAAIASIIYLISGLSSRSISRYGIGPDKNRYIKNKFQHMKEFIDGYKIIEKHSEVGRGILTTAINRGGETALIMMALLLERNTFNPPNKPDLGLKSLGFVLAFAGVGIGIGALTSPLIVKYIGRHKWIRIATLGSIPFLALVDTIQNQILLAVVAFFVGGLGQAVKVTNDALIQDHVIDEFRGRVFAFYDVAVNSGLIIGALVASFILPTTGKSATLPILSSLVFLWTGLWLLRKKCFGLPSTTNL